MMSLARKHNVGLFDPIFEYDEVATESGTRMADDFCGPERKDRKKSSTISDSQMARAATEMHEFLRSRDWTSAGPRHYVALYEWLHTSIYGVEPLLSPTDRCHAAGAAARMYKSYFDEDGNEMAQFMNWVWTRERGRETWRRDNKQSGGTIGWKLQFSSSLFTQMRIDKSRTKAGR